MQTFVLSVHAGWRCRSSLRCCQAGWPIAVEPRVSHHILRAAADGRLAAMEAAAATLPPEAWMRREGRRRWLATTTIDDGIRSRQSPHGTGGGFIPTPEPVACVFLERRGTCGLQRLVGEPAQPVSCRQFPRLAVIEDRRVSLSLTHYCPSAAALLFDVPGPLVVVADPPAFPADRPYEGLDVRGAVAPWLRPGVWLDPDARETFEREALRVLDRGLTPEVALATLRAGVSRAVGWSPAEGPLASHLERVLGTAEAPAPSVADVGAAVRALTAIEACAPRRLRTDTAGALAPSTRAAIDAARVVPVWPTFSRPLRAWLAARLVASWVLWQGDGLQAVVRSLELGLLALRALCVVHAARHERLLDRALFLEALGEADLLLVQRADPRALARLASDG